LGEAKLQNGIFKLIHILELGDYERAVDSLDLQIQQKLSQNNSLLPFLLHDINQLKSQLRRLKPRVKRSINALGKAWKWIAGSPDHDDHQIVVDKINGLLANNDRQRIINKDAINRINLLTNTTNQILKTIRSLEKVESIFEETISNKLKILKEEITNVEYAIQWAKVGVINSFILSEREISEAKKFLDEEKFPYDNLEEALGFATVRIATNESTILYIVNLPAIDKKICERLLLKPVKRNQTIIKINSENIIKCKNEIYQIETNCNVFNQLCICNNENLKNISNSNCISALLNSEKHNCPVINNQHVPSVQEISEGLLLINQFNGPLRIFANTTYQLTGTFLIQFHNDTITVGNRTFISKEISTFHPLPAVLQLADNKSQLEEVLSLEMMKELQINNVEELSSISTTGKIVFSLNLLFLTLLILCVILTLLKLKTKATSEINITAVVNENAEPESTNLEQPSTLQPKPQFRSANDLPAF